MARPAAPAALMTNRAQPLVSAQQLLAPGAAMAPVRRWVACAATAAPAKEETFQYQAEVRIPFSSYPTHAYPAGSVAQCGAQGNAATPTPTQTNTQGRLGTDTIT